MTGEIEIRPYIDGQLHYYYSREFSVPMQEVVTPLHADISLHPDDHVRRKVGDPVEGPSRLELCEACAVARRRLESQARVAPSPRPRTGRHPERRGRATSASAGVRSPLALAEAMGATR